MKGLRPGFPGNLQVLVVDGAELEGQFKELGYAATLCASAREAALSLSRGQSTPDVLLAEARSVHVGDADSQWLLGQARARNLPLVLMSATGGAGEVMKGIELGAVDYLEKPVSLDKLRNIWQHVVRKVMQVTVQEKPMAFSLPKVQAQPPAALENAASGNEAAVSGPSPSASVDCGAPSSGVSSHSAKCASEAEASSCSENTKCRRVLRSADTTAESSGGKASACDGSSHGSAAAAASAAAAPNKASKLSRASSSSAPTRVRSKRSAPARSRSDAALQQQKHPQPAAAVPPAAVSTPAPAPVSYPVCSSLPATAAVPWQPGCTWAAPIAPMPMGWQPVGMPASFMPVDSSPMATGAGLEAAAGKGAAMSPASLPSITSFSSALSCNTELDLPFPSAGDLSAITAGAVSPSFGSSDTSLHSDFTDLMLPNDLDLDLMFGDGLDGLALFGVAADPLVLTAARNGAEATPADKPPIGLSLRKTQSLVDLINAQLSAQQPAAAAPAAASGIAPMQCA